MAKILLLQLRTGSFIPSPHQHALGFPFQCGPSALLSASFVRISQLTEGTVPCAFPSLCSVSTEASGPVLFFSLSKFELLRVRMAGLDIGEMRWFMEKHGNLGEELVMKS